MDTAILLAELRALCDDVPPFDGFGPTSKRQHEWLGKAHALLTRYDSGTALDFRITSDFLGSEFTRQINLTKLAGILQRAVSDLELKVPRNAAQAFGPGAVYDFFRSLKEIISSASFSLFITDTWMDDEIFHTYLSSLDKPVKVRLLARENGPQLKAAAEKFMTQTKIPVEIRLSRQFHDRVIFVDDRSCWILGMSIKDAAKNKPTYIAPLPHDVSFLKLEAYETVWASAAPL
jgi:hypothetical protein